MKEISRYKIRSRGVYDGRNFVMKESERTRAKTSSLCLLLILVLIPTNVDARSYKPCRVQRIYVAELGSGDKAASFRSLLAKQLSKRGFTAVDKQGKADAVLTGIVSIGGSRSNEAVNFQRAEIKDRSGERLWRSDFHWTDRNSFSLLSGRNIKIPERMWLPGSKRLVSELLCLNTYYLFQHF